MFKITNETYYCIRANVNGVSASVWISCNEDSAYDKMTRLAKMPQNDGVSFTMTKCKNSQTCNECEARKNRDVVEVKCYDDWVNLKKKSVVVIVPTVLSQRYAPYSITREQIIPYMVKQ